MSSVRLRGAVSAAFAGVALGRVADLDIGAYNAPEEAEFQFYVFSVAARRDIVRFSLEAPLALPAGRLGDLLLCDLHGARYRTEACYLGCETLAGGGYRHTFESQGNEAIRAPAVERHGAGNLAAALLLDALDDDE
jgi:hypothetical protein